MNQLSVYTSILPSVSFADSVQMTVECGTGFRFHLIKLFFTKTNKQLSTGTSLAVQWLRLCVPVQEARV